MVLTEVRGDIFTTEDKHIVFVFFTEGINDGGFAGMVASKFFPEIIETGGNKLGEVLSKTVGEKTFHGIVCHSLRNGWVNADEIILKALNEMRVEENMSIIAIGTGLVGILSGAPTGKIYEAFEKCNKNLTPYMF